MNDSLDLDRFFASVISSSDDAIICKDLNSVVKSWNRAAERMFGFSANEMLGSPITKIFPEDKLHEEALILDRIKKGCRIEHYDTERLHKNGKRIFISVSISPIYNEDNEIVGVSSIARDVSERVRLQRRIDHLLSSIQHYQSVVESSEDAIIAKDIDGHVISWNRGAEKLFGYTAEEMLGRPMLTVFPPDRIDEEEAILSRIATGERIEHYETERLHKSGQVIHVSVTVSPIYNAQGQIVGASKIARNITKKIKEQNEILFQSRHDSLTKLPNRKFFIEMLDQTVAKSLIKRQPFVVAILDLDRFKFINDVMGHRVGDEVLVHAANKLRKVIKSTDFVGRIGGDEFTMLLQDFNHLFEVEVLLKRVNKVLATPFVLAGNKIHISASIGVSLFPDDSLSADDLLRQADQALYEAKRAGKNQFKFFTQELEMAIQKKKRLIADLSSSMELQQLCMVYQPIIEPNKKEIEKFEALIRWKHPELGMILPTEFIPLAEEANLINPITDWVFNEVIKQLKIWQLKYGRSFQVSINLSPIQLASRELQCFRWANLIKQHGLSPDSFVVEITEGAMVMNTAIVMKNLESLKMAGIQIAIDDFGTGYSCLSYLHNLDVDFVKIDKSFVSKLSEESKDTALCDAIIAMAHKLGLEVIAEGVEKAVQYQHLTSTHCDYLQGYLISEPLTSNELELRFQDMMVD